MIENQIYMKRFLFLITALIMTLFGACKKGDTNNTGLLGKWKLVANYYSIGGPPFWQNVPADNNAYVQFDNNGNLFGTAFTGYSKYIVKDSVTLTFTGTSATENYRYKLNHDTLIMSPAGPNFCIEGCAMRFVK